VSINDNVVKSDRHAGSLPGAPDRLPANPHPPAPPRVGARCVGERRASLLRHAPQLCHPR
jgi:hypothetical protein